MLREFLLGNLKSKVPENLPLLIRAISFLWNAVAKNNWEMLRKLIKAVKVHSCSSAASLL
ncbi:hypothetical protein BSZ32_11995 [Rubritalea profundi]|uniref:Uncharacterized protein n=1 Tax=Rubritalea profundi TaxID=1658618 RepID=A0A2S7U3Y1_9BACT|nr:hypothetical protein BSZ32_11995 [Rubritalea profundi]